MEDITTKEKYFAEAERRKVSREIADTTLSAACNPSVCYDPATGQPNPPNATLTTIEPGPEQFAQALRIAEQMRDGEV